MTNILVTGGTGMIGRYLVPLLIDANPENNVTVASLDGEELCHPEAKFKRLDLRDINNCLDVCKGMD